jgi:CubicO group peptidase (beta-lactamase class C family)
MLPPQSKVSTLLIFFVLLSACSDDASLPQPTEKKVAVEEPTDAPTLVPSPLPTVPPTLVPTAAPEDPELNRKFGAAVQDYVRESWGGWDEGEFIGQCLIDNATSLTATTREAVIQHGIDDAFSAVSGNDLASLSTAWDLCETEAASAEDETVTTEETDSTPELDAAFGEAVNTYLNSTWSGWAQGQSIGQCLIATAGTMTEEAKQGVIQYGIEEAIDELSGTHLQSLQEAWSQCESDAQTAETIPTDGEEDTSTGGTSTSSVTIDFQRAPAPTFVSLTSYNQFEDAHQSAFKTAVDTEFDPITEKAGVSVAVYSDGKLWQYAKGIASPSAEMTVNTPIEIKSTSKTFMSALILDQVEDGLYSLTDTLSSALANHPGYASVETDRINTEVTIDELLTMKSGLNTYHMISENFTAIEKNPIWKPIEHLNMTPSGYNDPGTYKYNDTNTIILAIIAEHAAGKPLNYLYKSIFFDPLGLSAALLPQDGAPPDTADEYGDRSKCGDNSGFGRILDACNWYTKDEWLLALGKNSWAAAGIVSTADNMARWAYELYSSEGLALSASARSQLLNSGSVEPVLFANKTHHYGYHVAIYSMNLIDGSALDIYGHIGGGGKSVMYYSPDLDLSIAILANSALDRVRGVCGNSVPFCILHSIYEAYQ